MGNITPYTIYRQNLLHVIIPKKTQMFYGLQYEPIKIGEKIDWQKTTKQHITQVFVTLSTTSIESTIIEADEIDRIILNQKKGEVIDKKTRKNLEKSYKVYKDIHEYAEQHPGFREPPYIKKMFAEPEELEKAIQNIVLKNIKQKHAEKA